MIDPKLLLVDEPTIGLAPKICLEIVAALKRLNEKLGLTTVNSEQNVNFALSLAQEFYLLETGYVRLKGTPEELQGEEQLKEAYFGG